MEQLIKTQAAYKIFLGDRDSGRFSHAYALHFADRKNLRKVLSMFATAFFSAENDAVLSSRIEEGSFPDCIIYPEPNKKITVDGISELISSTFIRAVENDKKLIVITDFDTALPLYQNKLLKTLEEPPQNVHIILGMTSTSGLLDTVKSRVKLLTIPPFSDEQIFEVLEKRQKSPKNREAAIAANGCLGEAENIVYGDWYPSVSAAADELLRVRKVGEIMPAVKKYGEIKEREQLFSLIRSKLFLALSGKIDLGVDKQTIIFALEECDRAFADLKFNAFFQGLVYDFLLRIITHGKNGDKND